MTAPTKDFQATLTFDGKVILKDGFYSYAQANSACDEREARYRADTGAMGYRFKREIF